MCVAWKLPHLFQAGILRKVFYDLSPIAGGRLSIEKVNFVLFCKGYAVA
jgi:hypothetical protein